MSGVKSFPSHSVHRAARNAMLDALRGYDQLTSVEMLAIAAQLVGNLIAFQDQRTLSPDLAMELVNANIVEGNMTAIHAALGAPEGSA